MKLQLAWASAPTWKFSRLL